MLKRDSFNEQFRILHWMVGWLQGGFLSHLKLFPTELAK